MEISMGVEFDVTRDRKYRRLSAASVGSRLPGKIQPVARLTARQSRHSVEQAFEGWGQARLPVSGAGRPTGLADGAID